jgi:hypothetical protein
MTRNTWLVLAVALCLATFAASAQRGGGGGRGSTARPSNSAFDSAEYGIGFPAPSAFELYTAEEPGRYRRLFEQRHLAILVNPMQAGETIAIRVSGNLSEADLKGYRDTVETNPPQAKMAGFEKVSVADLKVGHGAGKDAVDYVYKVSQEKTDETIRQVVFLHKGRGFMITCTAEQKRFEKANKEFSRFLASLEFK